MKAITIDPAASGNYVVVDLPDPVAAEDETVLEMQAATINFRDHIVRSYPVSPYTGDARGRIAGSDGVGVAISTGSAGHAVDTGGRYMPSFFPNWLEGTPQAMDVVQHLGGSASGVMAQKIAARTASLVAVPDHLTSTEAAALPCAGVTAWAALAMYGAAREGQTALFQGTGGVAILGLQIAKAMGLKTIITSSSDEKLARAKAIGADIGINYRTHPDWAQAVLDATDGRGADHVLDLGGEATMAQSLAATAMGGNISLVGVLTGLGGSIDGTALRGRILHLNTIFVESRTALQQLGDFVARHRIRPVIDQTFAMDEANAALSTMLAGKHFGKIGIDLAA